MILERLKNWGLILLGILAAIATAGYYRQKAGRESDKRKASEGARQTEHEATDAMVGGQKREAKEANNALADYRTRRRRDHLQ